MMEGRPFHPWRWPGGGASPGAPLRRLARARLVRRVAQGITLAALLQGCLSPLRAALPAPYAEADVGAVGLAGGASASNGTWTVYGAGSDIYYLNDSFHYVYRAWTGDVDVIARVVDFGGASSNAHAKAGLMLRQSLAANAPAVTVDVQFSSGIECQRRYTTGGLTTSTTAAGLRAPYWVRLKRSQDSIAAYYSADGTSWVLQVFDTVAMADPVYVGLVVCAHDTTRYSTNRFDNFSVSGPGAPPPALSIAPGGGAVVVSWPSELAGLQLQSAADLSPPVRWLDCTGSPVVAGTRLRVTNLCTAGAQFYRLKEPLRRVRVGVNANLQAYTGGATTNANSGTQATVALDDFEAQVSAQQGIQYKIDDVRLYLGPGSLTLTAAQKSHLAGRRGVLSISCGSGAWKYAGNPSIANGDYDSEFQTAFASIQAAVATNEVLLCLDHEFDDGSKAGQSASTTANLDTWSREFKAAWRHVVDLQRRSQPTLNAKWYWNSMAWGWKNANKGTAGMSKFFIAGSDAAGRPYMDYVSYDRYVHGNDYEKFYADDGVQNATAFARAQGRRIIVAEWGVAENATGTGQFARWGLSPDRDHSKAIWLADFFAWLNSPANRDYESVLLWSQRNKDTINYACVGCYYNTWCYPSASNTISRDAFFYYLNPAHRPLR